VNLFGNPVAVAERERQLVELLQAVHHAQQVARSMCNSRQRDNQVKLLFGRLEAVRLEVEQLRRSNGAVPFEETDPKWTGLLPWRMVPEC
jgi:RNA polymerase-interacting CarD/CdnL/TRCF family regulator